VSNAILIIEQANLSEESLVRSAVPYKAEPTELGMNQALRGDFNAGDELRLPSKQKYSALKSQYEVA
jgi:hypothetical protein